MDWLAGLCRADQKTANGYGHLTRSRMQDSASNAAAPQSCVGLPPTHRWHIRPAVGAAQAVGRDMTKGQRAMAVAKIYPEPEKLRRTGSGTSATEGLTAERLSTARTVLQYAPDLATNVITGTRKAPARSRGQG